MAKSVIRQLADMDVRPGINRPITDPDQRLQTEHQTVRQTSWLVQTGMVQYAIPQLGWQRVALEGGNGIVAATAGGRSDIWGVQTDQPTQPGQQVFVAVDHDSRQAIILAHSAPLRVDPRYQFAFSSFVGSWSDLTRDPGADVYTSVSDAGGAWAAENGAFTDGHQGDYAIRTSTGMQFMVSPLELLLTADDITGLWVGLLEQSVELSGRQLIVAADGLRLEKRLSRSVAALQLSGELEFSDDVVPIRSGDYEQWRKTDCEFAYSFEQEPVEIFSYNVWAVSGGTIEHLDGDYIRTGAGAGVDFRFPSGSSLPQLSFLEYPAPEGKAGWYPANNQDSAREQLANRLKSWKSVIGNLHSEQLLASFCSMAASWVKGTEQYVRLDPGTAGSSLVRLPTASETESNSRSDAIRDFESVQFGEQTPIDSVFGGKLLSDYRHLASWIHPQVDGSLFIGNEAGTGIRITGTGVFIEGTSIRLASRKDISLLGRDINLRGNRNVNLTARTFMRLYSQRNLGLIGGLSGSGGVLIESRGNDLEFKLPDNAQQSVYSGIVMRSAACPVVLQGGDVLIHAGATGSGRLMMRSDAGVASLVTPYMAVTHSSGRLDTFGTNPERPIKSHYFGQNVIILDSTIRANSAIFSGSVSAMSNIQSFFGRMADSQGGRLQQVSPQGIATFNDAIQSTDRSREQVVGNWIADNQEVTARLTASGRILNRIVIKELSGGFASGGFSKKHYGTEHLQPSLMAVHQQDWGLPLRDMEDFTVQYKPLADNSGGPTYAWPGDTRGLQLEVPTLEPLERRVAKALQQDPAPKTVTRATFNQVFGTLRDDADE